MLLQLCQMKWKVISFFSGTSSNDVDTQDGIINSIINELEPLRGGNSLGKINIWVADAVLQQITGTPQFKKGLLVRIEELLRYTPQLEIHHGVPDGECTKTTVIRDKVVMTIEQTEEVFESCKARITVVNNSGQLKQGSYTLDSRKGFYYMGRETKERKNDIVVESVNNGRTNIVSRQHATILFKNSCFQLKADNGVNRTIIVRGNSRTTLNDSHVLHPLQDDDTIILGEKAGNGIELKFKMI